MALIILARNRNARKLFCPGRRFSHIPIMALFIIISSSIGGCAQVARDSEVPDCKQTRFINGSLNGIRVRTPSWSRNYGYINIDPVSKTDIQEIPVQYRWEHPTPLNQCQVRSGYIPLKSMSLSITKNNILSDTVLYNRIQLIADSDTTFLRNKEDIIKDNLFITVVMNERNELKTGYTAAQIKSIFTYKKGSLLCRDLDQLINHIPRRYCSLQYKFQTGVKGIVSFSIYKTATKNDMRIAVKKMLSFIETMKK